LTPLTVTPAWGETYRIISGERRWLGARHAGLGELPCMIRDYESEEMETLHLIACNKNREKNMGQRVNEFLRYKQLLCHFPELSENSNISSDEKIKNNALVRYLTELKINAEEPIRARDIIEQQTGYSKYWQQMSTIIFDDEYLDDKLEILKKAGAKKEVIDAVFSEWVAMRQLALAEKVSPNEAASSLKNLFADTLAKLQKKQKKAEPKAEKKVEAEPDGHDSDEEIKKYCQDFMKKQGFKPDERISFEYKDMLFYLVRFYQHNTGF
jgi:hypothetical protein